MAGIGRDATRTANSIKARFAEESSKAETQYAQDRADIVKDSGEEIRKIEQEHQEDLRQLTKEHNENMSSLLSDRDALGLVKEQQRFDDARAEKEREVNQEIAERRRDTAMRLQELSAQFAQERTERQRQYAEDIKENAIQAADRRKEAAAQYQAEIKQARDAQAQKLKELADASAKERTNRRSQFIAQLNDINVNLLGEKNLKSTYYNAMLADATAFITAYRARLNLNTGTTTPTTSSGSTASGGSSLTQTITSLASSTWDALADTFSGLFGGTRDAGGYASRGLYKMAWDGKKEFVMSNATTRAAEQVIGGQLTQESLMRVLSMGDRKSINYQDQRRFNSGMSARDRRAIRNDTQQLLEGLVRD